MCVYVYRYSASVDLLLSAADEDAVSEASHMRKTSIALAFRSVYSHVI